LGVPVTVKTLIIRVVDIDAAAILATGKLILVSAFDDAPVR
jgi:hypothetical protein